MSIFFLLFTLLMRSSIVKTIKIDWTKLYNVCVKLINCFLCKMLKYYKASKLGDEYQTSKNEVDESLKKLRAEVDQAMAKAQKALDDAKNNVNECANKIQNETKGQIQDIQYTLKAELDILKKNAKSKGVNIDDCLKGNEDRLVNLPNQFCDDIVHCVSDNINKGISYDQDALTNCQKVVDEIENINKEIKNCGHGFHATKCLDKLKACIEKNITSLPPEIEADAVASVTLISNLDIEVKQCAWDKVNYFENDGYQILKTIAGCVATKVNK